MKKLFLGLIVAMVLMLSGTGWAMTFSQPIEIGTLAYNRKEPPGLFVRYALPSSVENKYYDFGTGRDNVRMYINSTNILARAKFGDPADINNTVDVEPSEKIYELSTSDGGKIYVLFSNGTQGVPYGGINVVGKYNNGKYVSYVNTAKIEGMGYKGKAITMGYGSARGPLGDQGSLKLSVDGDAIIISCSDWGYDNVSRSQIKDINWQYILKWDETAQWFGIENVDL